jgi:hypothetical protein
MQALASRYTAWDGETIHLNRGYSLVPHGWIVFGEDRSTIQAVLYNRGDRLRETSKGTLPPELEPKRRDVADSEHVGDL